MATVDELRVQLQEAIDAGDEARAATLSTQYRDAQARAGQLPPVGRSFVAQTGREYQLAQRVVSLRRAGRDDEATNLTRVIARERYARRLDERGRNRRVAGIHPEAFTFGANRGVLNIGTLASGGRELIEDTIGGNRNRVTARQHMEDLSAVSDQVTRNNPVSAAAGEVTGAVTTLPVGGPATQAASRTARVTRAAATGAAYGGAQGASDAYVRDQDVVEGAQRGATVGAVTGGALSVLGQVLAPVLRSAGNRLADSQGLRLIAEHVNPQQLNQMVAAVRQYQRQFGRVPTLAEAAGMVDNTIAREAGNIVASRVPASQVAQQGADRIRGQHQVDLAEAITPTSSASSRVTTETTNRAMQAIAGSARVVQPGDALHTFLDRPNTRRLINSMPPETRDALRDVIDNGGPLTVRMLDNIRQQVGNLEKLKGADQAWTEIANEARRYADEITNNAYGRVLRQHGQNALREEIANEALRSPAAAQRVARDLAESAARRRDLTAELGTAEATRLRNAGSTIQRAGRGVDEFRPSQALSRGEEAAANVTEGARALLLPKTGGAGTAAFIARNVARLGVSPREAEQFARDFTDPSRTQAALAFLQQRIGRGPASNFMAMLERAGIRPTVERVAVQGARAAARGPETELRDTQELIQDEEQATAEPTAAPAPVQINESVSSEAQALLAQAEAERDEGVREELMQVYERIVDVERLLIQAVNNGDEEGALALAQQRRRILDNEQ